MRARLIIGILLLALPHATGCRIFCILKLGDECILSGLQAFGGASAHRASGSESMTNRRQRLGEDRGH